MLLPNLELLFPVRDNILLLTAVAAACCVPFLSRADEEFARPRPAVHAPPGPSKLGWVPLLGQRLVCLVPRPALRISDN
ncbi:hypothetical protein, partial [Streptomyces sp. NPDC060275]|uniref:hypothetical protein n=1 Tax=Streptomyces sp. NPDC060275 TaxID=3347090 RepID=UPI003658A16F